MPGFDGSGPTGNGPMSGEGRGFCRSTGKRRGRAHEVKGQRGGHGWCRGYGVEMGGRKRQADGLYMHTMSPDFDGSQTRLEAEVSELRNVINTLQQRLDDLS